MADTDRELVQKQKRAFDELGVTGLARSSIWRGSINEEFLPELSGLRARRVFREMRDNDPVVGAMFFAIEMLLRNVDWRMEGAVPEHVEFLETCLTDMSHTWTDFVTEVLSMLTYGFSWHEVVYKRRNGEDKMTDRSSRYDDGKIGWAKMPIRSQDSLQEWEFEENGDVRAFIQSAPPVYTLTSIPSSRSLLFRVGSHKGNPEGRSLLRNAWRPWLFKKHIEEIEAIGIERDLAGLPVIYMTGDLESYREELKKILRNIRRDEQEGLLLPLVYDDRGNECLKLELLGSPGQRQIDISAVIDRYDKRIAMICMADFLLLGQQSVGSFALASSKTHLFSLALGAIMKVIADTLNRHAIPRLMSVNGWTVKDADMPHLVPGDVETPNLQELGAYVTALAGAGMPLFPDDELEKYLRTAANLPAKPEEGTAQAAPPSPQSRQGRTLARQEREKEGAGAGREEKPEVPEGEEKPEVPEGEEKPEVHEEEAEKRTMLRKLLAYFSRGE